MSFLRAIPRFFLFLAVIAAVAAVFWFASQWTRSQSSAYEDEGSESGLVRNTGAPWRNLNPDNLETQALEFYLNFNRQAIDEPMDSSASPVPFHVELGETGFSISERLQDQELIRDASLFRLYLRLNGLEQKLEAGDFTLSAAMTVPELADALQRALSQDVVVRFPEGRRAEEIALLLEEQGVVDAADFMAAVRTGDTAILGLPDYPLLSDKPPGVTFEGYLFPDTYRLPVGARASDVLRVMFETLEFRVDDDLRSRIAAGGLTFHQVLTLASIVERETALADERPLIASTYRNRLGDICANEVAGYLGADPTAQYAMGYSADQETWWPTVQTVEEYLNINSPYNTYLYPGLPPGPIANPGIASIEAALNPAETLYCYFVASSGGAHVFAQTGAEHQFNVQTYQQR